MSEEARSYDACFHRQDDRALGAKPYSAISSWDGWPDDVRALLRHWNARRRLSFRGGSFAPLRLPGQPRLGPAGLDLSRAVFRCARCAAPAETHPYGRAVLDGQALCDECLVVLAREWQDGEVSAGQAFDELACLLKKPYDELAEALRLNPKTARRWLAGHEPEPAGDHGVFRLHALLCLLARSQGEQEARRFVKERWRLVEAGRLEELVTQAERLIFPRDEHRRRPSALSETR